MPTKKIYCFKLFTFYILKSVYIVKKSKSHKILKIAEGFSYSFPLLMEVEGSGSVQIIRYSDPDPRGPKNSDPTDPDPQHCFQHLPIAFVGDVNLLVRLVNHLRERNEENIETKKSIKKKLPFKRVYAITRLGVDTSVDSVSVIHCERPDTY